MKVHNNFDGLTPKKYKALTYKDKLDEPKALNRFFSNVKVFLNRVFLFFSHHNFENHSSLANHLINAILQANKCQKRINLIKIDKLFYNIVKKIDSEKREQLIEKFSFERKHYDVMQAKKHLASERFYEPCNKFALLGSIRSTETETESKEIEVSEELKTFPFA